MKAKVKRIIGSTVSTIVLIHACPGHVFTQSNGWAVLDKGQGSYVNDLHGLEYNCVISLTNA